MKPSRLIPFVLIPLLVSCLPKKPEISLPAVPVRPLIEALEQRRQAFAGLKAVASVEAVRSGRKRTYDSVGIVIDGQRRIRVEAYGPLGQPVVTLVWNGTEVQLRLEDGREVRPGRSDLEEILGIAIDAEDLCAVLTGNIPAKASSSAASAFRDPSGNALVELSEGETERLFSVMLPEAGPPGDVRITESELYRSGRLMYRVRYGEVERVSQYLLAKTVKIENPSKKTSFTVAYTDIDVNSPLPDDAFILPGGETGKPQP